MRDVNPDTPNLLYFTLTALEAKEWQKTLDRLNSLDLDDDTQTVTMAWANASIIARPSTVRAWIETALA